MSLNNQSRALIIASKAQGWDPTVIPGLGSIANFDYDPGIVGQRFVGTLSDGTQNSWPDGYDATDVKPVPPSFNTPILREDDQHATFNADPFPGFPKGSY